MSAVEEQSAPTSERSAPVRRFPGPARDPSWPARRWSRSAHPSSSCQKMAAPPASLPETPGDGTPPDDVGASTIGTDEGPQKMTAPAQSNAPRWRCPGRRPLDRARARRGRCSAASPCRGEHWPVRRARARRRVPLRTTGRAEICPTAPSHVGVRRRRASGAGRLRNGRWLLPLAARTAEPPAVVGLYAAVGAERHDGPVACCHGVRERCTRPLGGLGRMGRTALSRGTRTFAGPPPADAAPPTRHPTRPLPRAARRGPGAPRRRRRARRG